jgi:hypothetical protein
MADRADLEFTYSLIDRIFRLSLGELADSLLTHPFQTIRVLRFCGTPELTSDPLSAESEQLADRA